jgi:hypothetical protein
MPLPLRHDFAASRATLLRYATLPPCSCFAMLCRFTPYALRRAFDSLTLPRCRATRWFSLRWRAQRRLIFAARLRCYAGVQRHAAPLLIALSPPPCASFYAMRHYFSEPPPRRHALWR